MPSGRSTGAGKGIEPKPRWIRRGKGGLAFRGMRCPRNPLGPLSPSKAPREDGTTNLWCFPATLQVPCQPLVVIL